MCRQCFARELLRITLIAVTAFGFVAAKVWGSEANLTVAEAKVHYTYEVAKHITWPNEDSLAQFTIGLYGVDSDLRSAFQAKGDIRIRDKAVLLKSVSGRSVNPNDYDILFVSSRKRSVIKKLMSRAKSVLIISEGRVDKSQQMVSLIKSRNNIKIRLNRDNLNDRGFLISNNLLSLAGTKEDLSEKLKENSQKLQRLLDQVQQKQAVLDKQVADLRENESQLKLAEENLSATLSDIEKQKLIIAQKQAEIAKQEMQVADLQKSIEENKVILAEQGEQLTQQRDTIAEQRGWMLSIATVLLVFCIMCYFLWRTNMLRKKANKRLAELNSQLYELATTDGMTKLFNRRHFLESAQKEMIRQQRKDVQAIILMMDIDHFKSVNDRYGHAMGDEVIKYAANVFTDHLRPYDLVGRIGGEEYAMMLVECDLKLGSEIAHRLCQEIANRRITYGGVTLGITISIGICALEQNDKQIEQALSRADKALYQAKALGRNQAVIYSNVA